MTALLAWAAGMLAASALGATNESFDAEIEGRSLAQELRELRPAENSALTGVLKIIKSGNKPVVIPVRFETAVTETNWWTVYSTPGTNQISAASLTVFHAANQPNQYRLAKSSLPPGDTNNCLSLAAADTMIPFADSEFWLADLGLEFFHWPGQRLLKKEIKRGQSCSVLESKTPQPATNGYARVVSWIDIDTGGIVQAEAYDAKGKLLKEFEPKGFRKVKGQWQVEELFIRNVKTGARSRLEYNLDKE